MWERRHYESVYWSDPNVWVCPILRYYPLSCHIIQWWIMLPALIRWDSNLTPWLEIKKYVALRGKNKKKLLYFRCLISGIKFPCYSPNKHLTNFGNNHSLLNCVEAFNLVWDIQFGVLLSLLKIWMIVNKPIFYLSNILLTHIWMTFRRPVIGNIVTNFT